MTAIESVRCLTPDPQVLCIGTRWEQANALASAMRSQEGIAALRFVGRQRGDWWTNHRLEDGVAEVAEQWCRKTLPDRALWVVVINGPGWPDTLVKRRIGVKPLIDAVEAKTEKVCVPAASVVDSHEMGLRLAISVPVDHGMLGPLLRLYGGHLAVATATVQRLDCDLELRRFVERATKGVDAYEPDWAGLISTAALDGDAILHTDASSEGGEYELDAWSSASVIGRPL